MEKINCYSSVAKLSSLVDKKIASTLLDTASLDTNVTLEIINVECFNLEFHFHSELK